MNWLYHKESRELHDCIVSKETGAALVGEWKQLFGFINRVDNIKVI